MNKNIFNTIFRKASILLFFSLLFAYKIIFANSKRPVISFYSPAFAGHGRVIYDALQGNKDVETIFILPDKAIVSNLRAKGYNNIFYEYSSGLIKYLIRPNIFITTNGGYPYQIVKNYFKFKSIELWHGIPFKGFTPSDFSDTQKADRILVSSKEVGRFFVEKWGCSKKQIGIVGYPSTDIFFRKIFDKEKIKNLLGLPKKKKIILYAPTWRHESDEREIFILKDKSLMKSIEEFCEKNNCIFIIRTHLFETNPRENYNRSLKSKNIFFFPAIKYPRTDEFLYISDLLISDWSSISNDYIVSKNPIIYIDLTPPFKNGFSLLPTDRVGYIVKKNKELLDAIEKSIKNPGDYIRAFGKSRKRLVKRLYDNTLDGKSTERCIKEILKLSMQYDKNE